jgi:hypothetical protein
VQEEELVPALISEDHLPEVHRSPLAGARLPALRDDASLPLAA